MKSGTEYHLRHRLCENSRIPLTNVGGNHRLTRLCENEHEFPDRKGWGSFKSLPFAGLKAHPERSPTCRSCERIRTSRHSLMWIQQVTLSNSYYFTASAVGGFARSRALLL
jgi:hypothetical protein